MELIKKLEALSVIDEIYAAIDTNDMAKIVTAASNALNKARCINSEELIIFKSKKMCKYTLQESNEYYKARLYDVAVYFNNTALALAPRGSKEMMLAYGIRSEIMFELNHYKECQEDVKTCISMNCPESYRKQLTNLSNVSSMPILVDALMEAQTLNTFLSSFFRFDCKRNADVPCVSADVTYLNKDGEKQASACKDIQAGAVVAIERAFTSCVEFVARFLTCYYCHRRTPCLYPCEGCCQALFCSNDCRVRCMKEYHRIECQILDSMVSTFKTTRNVLVTRTAIKLSLNLGWDKLIKESENIGSSRMKTATVRETYNSEDPLSMLSYDDEKICFEGKIFNGSIICAKVLHHLDRVPNYFPKETSKRKAAKEAMSRIMLHLYVTFTNTIPITCAGSNNNSKSITITPSNWGWFSMTSKLKHSCEPNLVVVGLNDSVALVALRTIKEGEELTISYIEHFYLDSSENNLQKPHLRATELFMRAGYICKDCRVCNEDWNAKSDNIPTVMTLEQSFLRAHTNRKYRACAEHYRLICDSLDKFPLRTFDHKRAYELMYYMMGLCQYEQTKT